MRSGLVVDPVEAGLDGEAGQEPVLAAVPVRGSEVHGPALVVQGAAGVMVLLVPRLRHAQAQARPLVHHGYSQRVQLLFTPLKKKILY